MSWAQIIQLLEQLLPAALQAVATVEAATGKPTAAATVEVVNHLTPGQPNSPTLTSPAA
jgi:hypothetical protein